MARITYLLGSGHAAKIAARCNHTPSIVSSGSCWPRVPSTCCLM